MSTAALWTERCTCGVDVVRSRPVDRPSNAAIVTAMSRIAEPWVTSRHVDLGTLTLMVADDPTLAETRTVGGVVYAGLVSGA